MTLVAFLSSNAPLAVKAGGLVAGAGASAAASVLQVGAGSRPAWQVAFFFALLSGASLPLGAIVGIYTTLSDETVASCLAFGAGALLFAVTVELYGEAMIDLEHDGYIHGSMEVLTMCAAAMGGALIYVYTNRWMERVLTVEDVEDDEDSITVVRRTRSGSIVSSKPLLSKQVSSSGSFSKQLSSSTPLAPVFGKARSMPLAAAMGKSKSYGAIGSQVILPPQQKFAKSKSRVFAAAAAMDTVKAAGDGNGSDSEDGNGEKQQRLLLTGMATWLGVLIDGLPEGVLLGFLAADGNLSMALVISLFIANFPEAVSSSSMLRDAGKSGWSIFTMWTFLFVITAVLAGISAWAVPQGPLPIQWKLFIAVIEGVAGGAMLACITSVMLPEAYHTVSDNTGLIAVSGFLLSVLIKVFGGVASEWYE